MHDRHRMIRARLLLASAAILIALGGTARAQNAGEVQALRRQIEELRQQLKTQQQQIEQLQERTRQATEDAALAKAAGDKAQKSAGELAEKPLITSTNPKLALAVSGQVNRLLNLADDGKSTKAYFVDNNVSVSRLRVVGTGQVTDDFSIGTNVELAISPNNSADVSQDNEDGSQNDEFRKVEALFRSKTWGDIAFGKGDPATKDIARIDLSGTDVLAYARTGDPAGGLLFRSSSDDELTDVNVNSVFTDFDSGRTNRIRYDTPKLGGLYASGSYGADQKWGVALRWAGQAGGFKAAAGAGVQDPSSSTANLVYAGSASVLHEPTGLNLTYGTAWRDQDEGTGQLQYVKAGWQHGFFTFGATAFSIDFGLDKDTPADGDEGRTVGLVALQNISRFGTELFAGFRLYDLDQGNGPNTSTIYVGTVGTRVKF